MVTPRLPGSVKEQFDERNLKLAGPVGVLLRPIFGTVDRQRLEAESSEKSRDRDS